MSRGSADGFAEAFYKDAVMYGLTNGELLGGPIKNLYDFVEKNGTAPDIKTRIEKSSFLEHAVGLSNKTYYSIFGSGNLGPDVLAITPTTAVVRVDMEKDAIGADFHTLIKLNGTWHVIAKVYHMYEG